MTEAEWLLINKPTSMLAFLRGKVSDRKLRMFSVACCRGIWELLNGDACRNAVEIAERFADGLAGYEERDLASDRISHGAGTDPCYYAICGAYAPVDAAQRTVSAVFRFQGVAGRSLRSDIMTSLRDIFGNPFRPVAFDPNWRTSDVVAMARGIYETRDFAAIPILADALQDAGCEHAVVLEHCRGPRPHVRGCWVVDLILGKE